MKQGKFGFDDAFALSFFVFLVVVAIVLLTLNSKVQTQRPEMLEDLQEQQVSALLTGVLRSQVQSTTVADLIILGRNSSNNDAIQAAFEKALPSYDFTLTLTYSDGTDITLHNHDYSRITDILKNTQPGESFQVEDSQIDLIPTKYTTYLPAPAYAKIENQQISSPESFQVEDAPENIGIGNVKVDLEVSKVSK